VSVSPALGRRFTSASDNADAKLTALLATLANCEKARSLSVHDRCMAVYEGL
jgi:hypothetical protein